MLPSYVIVKTVFHCILKKLLEEKNKKMSSLNFDFANVKLHNEIYYSTNSQ